MRRFPELTCRACRSRRVVAQWRCAVALGPPVKGASHHNGEIALGRLRCGRRPSRGYGLRCAGSNAACNAAADRRWRLYLSCAADLRRGRLSFVCRLSAQMLANIRNFNMSGSGFAVTLLVFVLIVVHFAIFLCHCHSSNESHRLSPSNTR